MKFVPLCRGELFPELYHLGFNGTELQIFMGKKTWDEHFRGKFGVVTPWIKKPTGPQSVLDWGDIGKAYEIFVGPLGQSTKMNLAAQIKVYSEHGEDSLAQEDLRRYSTTIHQFLAELWLVLAEDSSKIILPHPPHQLFGVATCILQGVPTGYEPHVSISPRALAYIAGMKRKQYEFVSRIMSTYAKVCTGDPEAYVIPTKNSLTFKAGNASIGPETEEGGYLRGHNVDTPAQQLVLLVGLAVIWQMVREGVKVGSV